MEVDLRDAFYGANVGIEVAAGQIRTAFEETLNEIRNELLRPSVIFRPALSLDGNAWCALLGENLQVGIAAFGDSPDEAMRNFDKAWRTPFPSPSPEVKG